jgi:hypothetical protein
VTYILQTFNHGIVCGPADIISAFNFSPRAVKHAEGNCILTSSHSKMVANVGMYAASLMHTQKIENQGE